MDMKKLWIFGLFFVTAIESAMATVDDGEVVTSKLYVDMAVEAKQDAIGNGANGGSGANGDVVTYTGTAGTVSSKPVYDETGSYTSAQQNALIEAKNVNAAVQNGLNQHVTCRDWAGNNPSSGDCWIWQINTNLNGTYVPYNVSIQ